MAYYTAIKLYADKSYTEVKLNYNEPVEVDGQIGIENHSNSFHYLTFYDQSEPILIKNKIASKLAGRDLYGTVIITSSIMEEDENEDYIEDNYDDETNQQYITKPRNLDKWLFRYICETHSLRKRHLREGR